MPAKTAAGTVDRFGEIPTLHASNYRSRATYEEGKRISKREFEAWLRAEAERLCPICLEVRELESTVIVKVKPLGFSAEELAVKVEPRVLTIARVHRLPRRSQRWKSVPPPDSAQRCL